MKRLVSAQYQFVSVSQPELSCPVGDTTVTLENFIVGTTAHNSNFIVGTTAYKSQQFWVHFSHLFLSLGIIKLN